MKLNAKLLLLPLFALVIQVQLHSQATSTGTIQGAITDSSQAVIAGAKVTATNTETSVKRTVTTGDTGIYLFTELQPGYYAVTAGKDGFATGAVKVDLLVGQTITGNFTLKPGRIDEVVEVNAANVLLDVTNTSISQQVTPSEVEELPLLGRDAANLAYLAPGVKAADSFDPTKNRSAVLSVNGNVGREVNITVNGVDNKDSTVGGTVMQLPLEGVQEFVISTQRFSAANGRSEGAAINMITKSGTNKYHGSAFSYFREQQFNADTVDPSGNHANPPYSRQFFGGSAGGPIVKNKLLGFFAYEREREATSIAEDSAAFAELTLAAPLGAVAAAVVPTPFFENRYNGRLDYKFSDKESAYLSISQQSNNGLNDQEDGLGDLSVGNFTVNHMQIANLTVNSVLTPTLVNAFTIGTQYWNNNINTKNPSAPYIDFPSGAWMGMSPNVSQQSFQRKFQFKDDVTKNYGKHTISAGVDYVWEPLLGGFFAANATLELDYSTDVAAILAMPLGFNTPGLVSGMSISNGDPATNVPGGTKQIGIYAQDDFKVNRRLTLNLGLRWDKDVNLIGGSAMVNSQTFLELKELGSPYGTLPHDDNKDFSPRIGFSYDLTGAGKHVLRGGYGLYYGDVFQNIPLWMEQMANKTVYQQAISITGATANVPGLNIPLSSFVYSAANVATITHSIPAATGKLLSDSTGRTMDPSYRNPLSQEFNFGYQWLVAPNWVLEADYTHMLGLHSNVDVNINYTDPVTGVRVMDAAYNSLVTSGYCPAGYCVLGRTMDNRSIGRTRYDGLIISVRHQIDKHFSLNANYTLSHAVGYGIDSGGNPTSVSTSASSYHNYPHDPRHPLAKWDFGPTPYDELHHLTMSGQALLPWGFEVAPILQAGSARPYDINSGYDVLGLGSGYSHPVIVPNSNPTAYTTYSDSTTGPAAAQACLASSDCHIVPYDTMRGSPFFELDARISKNLKLGESRRLQLSFQAFDLTNHANYANNYVYNITSSSFGKPAGFANPSGNNTAKAFIGEFGARFTF